MKRFLAIFTVLSLAVSPVPSLAKTSPDKFVRTANYFLKAGSALSPAEFAILASYDLVVLPMEAQVYNRDFFAYAREKNPDIIILPYVPCRSININDLADGAQIRKKLKSGILDEWYLKDSKGAIVSAWPGTIPINVATEWNEYLPRFVENTILSTGLWDGVFYDEVQDDMTYLNSGDIDLDRNGVRDTRETANTIWQKGMLDLFIHSRQAFGESALILTNGSSLPDYQPYVNGRMFENFPAQQEQTSLWNKVANSYTALFSRVKKPAIFIINANTRNSGNKTDYQRMRYGLATALLSDGYFSFDYGDKDHGQLWKYDEFDAYLGKPSGLPENVLGKNTGVLFPSVWKRDFQRGVVYLNATDENQAIGFQEEFEKIKGTQDVSINDGSIVSEIELKAKDGILLYRPLSLVEGAPFKNGSFARVFNSFGTAKRTGFFSYLPVHRGGTTLVLEDLDGDGSSETVVADLTTLTLYNEKKEKLFSLKPYGPTWKGGFSVALIDLDRDGKHEVLVAPESDLARGFPRGEKIFLSQTSTVKAYDLKGSLRLSFAPFGANYRFSVSLSGGRLDGSASPSIVVGSGEGASPEVRVFDSMGKQIKKKFFAYGKAFKGGVHVAVGDVSGDGTAEIVTAPGKGGKPHVRIFDKNGKVLSGGFYAFDPQNTAGVKIAVSDLDRDGRSEIIPMTMNVFTLSSIR